MLSWAGARTGLDVLDLGTGSGAIALTLRQEGDFGRVVATDLSRDALAVAAINLERCAVGEVELRSGGLYEPVAGERFDVIVSNPPYVASGTRGELAPEVVEWEPAAALFGGQDGLDVIRSIVALAPSHLRPGGLLALEIGADQGDAVLTLVRDTGAFAEPALRLDLARRDRIVTAELNRPA